MLTSKFTYCLPESLIAKHPVANRTASRLLCVDSESGAITHTYFHNIISYLKPNDLLIANDSKVIPARLFGYKETGGKVEVMLERILSDQEALAHIRASKNPKVNARIILAEDVIVQVLARVEDLFKIKFISNKNIFEIMQCLGNMPLPPYLARASEDYDKERYQTIYAKARLRRLPQGYILMRICLVKLKT